MNLDQQSDRQDHSVLLRLEGTVRELTRHRISPINAFLSGFCTHFLGELSFHLLHCLEQTNCACQNAAVLDAWEARFSLLISK